MAHGEIHIEKNGATHNDEKGDDFDVSKVMKKTAKTAKIIADFWIGMVGAGAKGVATAVYPEGKEPHERRNGKERGLGGTLERFLDDVVDNTAGGVSAAIKQAAQAGERAKKDLAELHGRRPRS